MPTKLLVCYLQLKIGALIILIRNFNARLVNGTRFVEKKLIKKVIEANDFNGKYRWYFKGMQFLIPLEFAMIKNKSQVLTFQFVAIGSTT